MPAPNTSSSRGRYNKKKGSKTMEQYKEVCPPHKLKDLDDLVKSLKGDEEKISLAIQEWWEEEPKEEEPQWEEINKNKGKNSRKAQQQQQQQYQQQQQSRGRGGGRGGSYQGGGSRKDGGGRGFRDQRGGGGRGSGGGGRKGGRGGRRSPPTNGNKLPAKEDMTTSDPALVTDASSNAAAAAAPKGVWGAGQPARTTQQEAHTDKSSVVDVPEPVTEKEPTSLLSPTNDPPLPGQSTKPPAVSQPAAASGNVWATKGSSHLIKEAEKASKPKPPPQPVVAAKPPQQQQQQPPQPQQQQVPLEVPSIPVQVEKEEEMDQLKQTALSTLDDEPKLEGLSASVIGTNVNAAGWEIQPTLPEPSPVVKPIDVPTPTVPDMPSTEPEPTVDTKPPPSPKKAPATVAPNNVLNMGHWGETGETDAGEEENLNFGFGSFGTADNEIASVDETTLSSSIDDSAAVKDKSSISTARPPPGLSINGGMPPMPANAVLVHELENKLENASLKEKQQAENEANITPLIETTNTTTTETTTNSAPPGAASILPPPQTMPSPNYNTAYSGMGMYNYHNAATSSGFVGMQTPTGPVLAGGVLQHQQQKPDQQQPSISGQTGVPHHLQQHQQQHQQQRGLYGAPMAAPVSTPNVTGTSTSHAAANNSNNNATPSTAGATSAPPAGMPPPGMPGAAMPYSPALFYGQQPYQMGQPHDGGIGYGYGYGAPQFGGAVQGGYGYQQVMGQPSGAYGQPNDNQPSQQHHGGSHNTLHSSGSGHQGGYQKSGHGGGGGGYRGRNSHHNNNNHHNNSNNSNQYQSHYNNSLQHGGYGQPPYSMGYNNADHFHQNRGGYGLQDDPYGRNSGTYGGGQSGGTQNQNFMSSHKK